MPTQNQNYLVIPLPDNFDENSLAQFSSELDQLLANEHIYFVFDLGRIDILNSKLVSHFENIYNRLLAVEKKMAFVNAKEEIREILEFVGLSKIIETFDEEATFVEAIERGEI